MGVTVSSVSSMGSRCLTCALIKSVDSWKSLALIKVVCIIIEGCLNYAVLFMWFCYIFLRVATELGAIPVTQYSVMGGGRFFPMVSREVSLID